MQDDYIYFRFKGPLADDGLIDIEKGAKTLTAFNTWFKKYTRDILDVEDDLILRIGAIKAGSSELQVYLDILEALKPVVKTSSGILIAGSIAKNLGIREFINQFMGTLGKQIALKVFAKGEKLSEKRRFVQNGEEVVELEDKVGASKNFTAQQWDIYNATNQNLNGLINLEKGKEEKLVLGYYDKLSGKNRNVATINYEEQGFFVDMSSPKEIAQRLTEPFSEDEAEEVKIVGQFVEYHGLAHKYYFSFQVRRKPKKYGKQKILCIVNENMISQILDLMKPENATNLFVKGLATRDYEGRLDKLKVEWISTDPDYNPDQISIDDLA